MSSALRLQAGAAGSLPRPGGGEEGGRDLAVCPAWLQTMADSGQAALTAALAQAGVRTPSPCAQFKPQTGLPLNCFGRR